MIQSNIVVDDASGTVEACSIAMRAELGQLISGLDGRFMRAGSALGATVEAIDRIIAALTNVSAALDAQGAGAAVDRLSAVAKRLSDLPEHRMRGERNFATIRAIANTLGEQIGDVVNTLRVLRLYGMNVKIAASGAEEFVTFVDIMLKQISRADDDVAMVGKRLKELRLSLGSIAQVDRLLAAECARVVPHVPDRLAAESAALGEHQLAVAKVAGEVGTVALAIQGKVGAALGALQVGDIARQRLEHVLAGLQLLHANRALSVEDEQGGRPAEAHVLHMLAAQLDSTADEFGEQAAVLTGSIAGIAPQARRLLGLREAASAGEGRVFLRRLEGSIGDIEDVTRQLRDADRKTVEIGAAIADLVDDLTIRIGTIRHVQMDVQQMAVNIGLRCRRLNEISRPVTVIAKEIRTYSMQLDETTTTIAGAVTALGGVAAAVRDTGDRTIDVNDALGQSLAVIRQAARDAEQAIEAAGDDAVQVVDMLGETASQLEEELSLAASIRTMAATLTGLAGPLVPLPEGAVGPVDELMLQIAKLYTMASERIVHQRFVTEGMTATVDDPPSAVDDDDDDGLF